MRTLLWPVDKVHVHLEPGDMRKSIDGLVAIVELELDLSPFSPALSVFSNRARDKVKMLYWERNGFLLWYKRLEKQRFRWPENASTMSSQQLSWLLDGLDIEAMQPHSTLQFKGVFTEEVQIILGVLGMLSDMKTRPPKG